MNKPTIETMINTAAILICTSGTTMLINRDVFGFLLVPFAAALEWFKYWGRSINLWK